MLCPVCHVLMSDILIHLKGCAKTVPLHTTLPANPRYWLGADSKATPVGLCTTRSQVTDYKNNVKKIDHKPEMPLIPIHMCLWFIFGFFFTIVASFSFLVNHHILSQVQSLGHSTYVFLFHMDTKVKRGGGWIGLWLPAGSLRSLIQSYSTLFWADVVIPVSTVTTNCMFNWSEHFSIVFWILACCY